MIIHWQNSRGEDRAGPRLAYFTLEGIKYVAVWSQDFNAPILLCEDEFTVQGGKGIQTRRPSHKGI